MSAQGGMISLLCPRCLWNGIVYRSRDPLVARDSLLALHWDSVHPDEPLPPLEDLLEISNQAVEAWLHAAPLLPSYQWLDVDPRSG